MLSQRTLPGSRIRCERPAPTHNLLFPTLGRASRSAARHAAPSAQPRVDAKPARRNRTTIASAVASAEPRLAETQVTNSTAAEGGRRILIACNEMRDAAVSMEWATRHILRKGDTLSLVHVAHPSELASPICLSSDLLDAVSKLDATAPDVLTPALRGRVHEMVQATASKLGEAQVPFDLHVVKEPPGVSGKACIGDALIQAAEQLDCALTVVATGSRGGLPELLTGSIANYVTHHSKRPVAVLHLPRSGAPAKLPPAGAHDIVVAVDGAEGSVAACRWTLEHLYRKGDTVHLMHVIPCLPLATELPPFDAGVPMNPAAAQFCLSMTEQEEKMWRESQEAKYKAIFDAAGATCKLDVIAECTESPVDTISVDLCRSAAQLSAKALVLCAYPHGPLSELLFSSVANQVSHHCDQPVVVLRSDCSAR